MDPADRIHLRSSSHRLFDKSAKNRTKNIICAKPLNGFTVQADDGVETTSEPESINPVRRLVPGADGGPKL